MRLATAYLSLACIMACKNNLTTQHNNISSSKLTIKNEIISITNPSTMDEQNGVSRAIFSPIPGLTVNVIHGDRLTPESTNPYTWNLSIEVQGDPTSDNIPPTRLQIVSSGNSEHYFDKLKGDYTVSFIPQGCNQTTHHFNNLRIASGTNNKSTNYSTATFQISPKFIADIIKSCDWKIIISDNRSPKLAFSLSSRHIEVFKAATTFKTM